MTLIIFFALSNSIISSISSVNISYPITPSLAGCVLARLRMIWYKIFMPGKNEIKVYLENGVYHLFNRGVEKRLIFLETIDYSVFLAYLKSYLLPQDKDNLRNMLTSASYKEKDKILKLLRLNNYYKNIDLIAYCLMPNHFHLLVKQKSADSINKFIKSLCTRYAMYFNKKYKRVGPLFQGNYKGVLVQDNEQLFYLSRYIHHQALYFQDKKLISPQPSSYPNYLGNISQKWVKPEEILSFFKTARRTSLKDILFYQSFVENNHEDYQETIAKLLLD